MKAEVQSAFQASHDEAMTMLKRLDADIETIWHGISGGKPRAT